MKVFISWSGKLSNEISLCLKKKLKQILQFCDFYVSSENVDKGSRWESEIMKNLSDTHYGILVVTSENKNAPWLIFEAGALSKTIDKAKVCPLLIGLEPTDVEYPLAVFQSAKYNKEDMKKLVDSLNNSDPAKSLDKNILDETFETYWPQIETEIDKIIESHMQNTPSNISRQPDELLEENLGLTRDMTKVLQRLATNFEMFPFMEKEFARGLAKRHSGFEREIILKLDKILSLIETYQTPDDYIPF
jgi:TIR domain